MSVFPAEKTSFVGRDADLVAIGRAIDAGARLVTLVGPGGIGKTRLARRWAAANASRFESVVFCDLTEARAEGDVIAMASAALGAGVESDEDGAEDLARAIDRRGEALVVLDNMEQITAHVLPTIGAWLDAAPAATFLVTSRERLGIDGEHRVELGPLPDEDAVGLFVARASAAGIDATASSDDLAVVAQIVRRLEGLPLAIELAAPRVTALGLRALRERIGEGLGWLATDRRDAAARQSTLHAAIAWSWDLLSAQEQRALARCAVFRGGFSARAAEAVIDAPDAIQLVQSLRNKSLVRAIDGESRLGLYESVRAYASEALDAAGERDVAEARHTAFHLAETTIDVADLHNALAVHAWCVRFDPPASVRVLAALAPAMKARGAADAMLKLVDASVAALDPSAHAAALAEALVARGEVQRVRGRMAESVADLARAQSLAPHATHPAIHARARATLAVVRWSMGREDEAKADADAALALFEAIGDRAEEGMVRCLLARMASRDLPTALAQIERALGLERDAGHIANEGIVLLNMGAIAHEHALLPRATEHFEAALAIFRRTEDRRFEATALARLGQIATERGDDVEAAERFAAALATFEEIGARRDEAIVLARIGALALHRGRPAEARAHLERALDRLRGRGDRYEGLCQAWFAAALAVDGARDEAVARIAMARGLIGAVGDDGHAAALGCLDAIVRGVNVSSDVAERARASSDARIALRVAEKRVATNGAHAEPAPRLVVGAEARWFEVSGAARVDLSRRRALRLLLCALTERRVAEAGVALSLDALVAAGWPGERIAGTSGTRRAYTAIGSLRDMGLRAVLIRRDDGYLLDPAVAIERR